MATHWLRQTETVAQAAGVQARRSWSARARAARATASCEDVSEALIAAKIERNDLVVALGGGVIGDLAGFAASVARRGMDFVQVPTTLLAQVDSSVGGKTGINSPHGKNLIGAFHQPRLVLADIGVLDTLPPRQFAPAMPRSPNTALIDDPLLRLAGANQRELFAGGPARAAAIARAARQGRDRPADERETGNRALLNLGHTFGHALEAATGFSDRLLHGEGVAIGMVLAAEFSAQLGMVAPTDAARVSAHLAAVGLSRARTRRRC